MNKQFFGIYAQHLRQYISLKRALGFKYETEEVMLNQFDKFTIKIGETKIGITKELALRWKDSKPNESDSYKYHRMVCLNQFSSYLLNMDIPSYIISLPIFKSSFTPYIFTKDELSTIFKVCDQIVAQKKNMSSIIIIIPSIIRLLYGTGLRISEAVALKNKDINLQENYLLVRDSKNERERVIPFSSSLSDVLNQYIKYRNMLPFEFSDEDYFFVSLTGKACTKNCVYKWFRKILVQAKIPRRDRGPRLHDLRHTFSVHSLVKMADSGVDIYCTLPILSRYLGHQTYEATNSYVRLTAEMYPRLLKDVEMIYLNVFPNTLSYETN